MPLTCLCPTQTTTSQPPSWLFFIMNKVIQLHTPKTTEEVIAFVLEHGEPVLKTYSFAFVVSSEKKVTDFLEVVGREFPDMRHIATREMAESCSEVEVVFETTIPESSEAFQGKINALRMMATRRRVNLWEWDIVGNSADAVPRRPAGVKMKMRTEFLHDALELRIALTPYVLHWTDNSVHLPGNSDCAEMLSIMDRDVELEICEGAPSLDHLRWYINQMVDMHVAAESLHYADRYTGARLPYHLLNEMESPVEVIEKMLVHAKRIAKWRGGRKSLLHDLVATLTGHLARLKGTA